MRTSPRLLASAAVWALIAAPPTRAQTVNRDASGQAGAATSPSGSIAQASTVDESAATSVEGQAEDIVVTGSRIDRAGFTAPTPTTVIGAEVIQQRAAVNIADVLNEVPSFRRSAAPESAGIANAGGNNVDLRGLGPIRTLVLLDRMRLPPINVPGSSIAGLADLNTVPTALISRVDVVTGGASAAYGSDAVAGVLNLQLNTKLEGVRATAQYGQTEYDDALEVFTSAAVGTSFGGGRGHIVLGGEYSVNSGTGEVNDRRPWGRRNVNLVTLPITRPAGLPATLLAENVVYGTLTTGGLIVPNAANNPVALRNLQFVRGSDGRVTAVPFNAGSLQGLIGTRSVGGEGTPEYAILRGESRRYNALANVTYDLTDGVEVWLQGLYSNVETVNATAQRRDATGGTGPFLNFRPDNAYLQQALTPAQLALVPAGGLSIGYLGNDFGAPDVKTRSELARAAGGLKGEFGGGWRWDVGGQYARSKVVQRTIDVSIASNFLNAIDAVAVTPTNVGTSGLAIGSIACRSRLTNPSSGCLPLNILGSGERGTAAFDYAFGDARAQADSTLVEVAANVNGEPFSLWAGPVSVGVGVEYRRETFETTVDPLSQVGGFSARTARNFPRVAQSVKEAYVETIVPLLTDVSFTKSLEFNGAFRITDYSISGSAETWKLGLTWKPIDDVRFRGALSRDIRAPSVTELFTPAVTAVPSPLVSDPRPAFVGQLPYAYGAISGGNVDLKPEIARTITLGVVIQPRFLSRLQLSADFYNIRVREAIGSAAPATTIQNCIGAGAASASNPFCSLITFDGGDAVNGRILSVVGRNFNFAEFKTKGLDLALSYVQPLDEISEGWDGRLAFNAQATYVDEFRSSLDVSTLYPNGVNRAGQTGALFGATAGLPSWLVNANMDYQVGRVGLNAQVRYISRGRQNNALIGPDEAGYSPALFNSISNNIIPAVTYVNFGSRYRVGEKDGGAEFFFVVNNAFNKAPPQPATQGNAYYDLLGRTYRAGMRFNF